MIRSKWRRQKEQIDILGETMRLNYIKAETISLKHHPEFNEAWLRDIIVDDPSILGLGDLAVKDVEKLQPHAGRLDILLHEPESEKRYEAPVVEEPLHFGDIEERGRVAQGRRLLTARRGGHEAASDRIRIRELALEGSGFMTGGAARHEVGARVRETSLEKEPPSQALAMR